MANELDQAYDEFQKFVDAVHDLNTYAKSEANHGSGFESKEFREEFKVFFTGKIQKVQSHYHNLIKKLDF